MRAARVVRRLRASAGEAAPADVGPPECPGCEGGALELFGPVTAPELIVGHCDECGGLYLVERDPVVEGAYRVLGRCGLMQPSSPVAQAG